MYELNCEFIKICCAEDTSNLYDAYAAITDIMRTNEAKKIPNFYIINLEDGSIFDDILPEKRYAISDDSGNIEHRYLTDGAVLEVLRDGHTVTLCR